MLGQRTSSRPATEAVSNRPARANRAQDSGKPMGSVSFSQSPAPAQQLNPVKNTLVGLGRLDLCRRSRASQSALKRRLAPRSTLWVCLASSSTFACPRTFSSFEPVSSHFLAIRWQSAPELRPGGLLPDQRPESPLISHPNLGGRPSGNARARLLESSESAPESSSDQLASHSYERKSVGGGGGSRTRVRKCLSMRAYILSSLESLSRFLGANELEPTQPD